jgi:hypothetical protein
MWTFRVEKENNLIMEHILPVLRDDIWRKWEQIFKDYESGEYVDPKTGALMKESKGFKPRKMVKNDLKQFQGLTEMELDMAADQILSTRDGEEHPRHTLKTVRDWAVNRKKKNETYIAMAQCLDPTPLYIVNVDKKRPLIGIVGDCGSKRIILVNSSANDLWTCLERSTF